MTSPAPRHKGPERSRVRTLAARLAGDIPGRYWLLLAGLFVIGYLYWHPWGKPWTGDSLYYTAMTFQYIGHDLDEAIRLTGEYFNDPKIDRLYYGFEDPVIAPLIYPRVVYPALSVPFVLLMGGHGMYVVPLLSAIFIVWGLMRLMTRLFTKEIALAVSAVFILTFSFQEFLTGLFTESPAIAFIVAILMLLPIGGRRFGMKEAVACAVLLVLITFSRQSGPIVVSAICAAWLWTLLKRRTFRGNPWTLPVLVLLPVGLAGTLVLQWWAPYDVLSWYVKVNKQPDTETALLNMPELFWKVTVADTKQYFMRDLGLLGIWSAALISCLARPKSIITALFLGALVPSMLLTVLNSTPSSFRYYLPMYPIVVLAAANLMHRLLVRRGSTEPAADDTAPGHQPADSEPRAVVV